MARLPYTDPQTASPDVGEALDALPALNIFAMLAHATALRECFPPRQIVELLLVIGSYHMLARIMTTLDIDLDPAAGSAVIDEAHRRLQD